MQRDGEYTPGPTSLTAMGWWTVLCLITLWVVGFSLVSAVIHYPDTMQRSAQIEADAQELHGALK